MPEEDYAVLKVDTAPKVIAATRIVLATAPNRNVLAPSSFSSPDAGIFFLNKSGKTVPPYACMRVKDYAQLGEDQIPVITQPDAKLGLEYLFNGPNPVPDGDPGFAQIGPNIVAAFDNGTPTFQQTFGPKKDQWTVSLGRPTLVISRGIVSSSSKWLRGRDQQIASVFGKPDETIDAAEGDDPVTPGEAEVTLWSDAGDGYQETTMSFTGYNASKTAVDADKFTRFDLVDGKYFANVGGGSGTILFHAQLTDNLLPNEEFAVISDLVGISSEPFEQPEDNEVYNAHNLAGVADDLVTIMYAPLYDPPYNYRVLQIYHHAC